MPPATGKWQVSVNGGGQPAWRWDGKQLFFLSSQGKMMAGDVAFGSTFSTGVPRELFQTAVPRSGIRGYDVSADGRKFLNFSRPEDPGAAPITVVLNWWAGLKK